MVRFKYYKQIIAAIVLAGFMAMVALRITDIVNWFGHILAAFIPLIIGGCIAFVLDVLVVRYDRFIFPAVQNRGGRRKVDVLFAWC